MTPNPNQDTDTLSLIWAILAAAAIWAGVFFITGCTIRINPDGSKDATVDAPTFLRAIEVIAEK
jgi:hypothetical protein